MARGARFGYLGEGANSNLLRGHNGSIAGRRLNRWLSVIRNYRPATHPFCEKRPARKAFPELNVTPDELGRHWVGDGSFTVAVLAGAYLVEARGSRRYAFYAGTDIGVFRTTDGGATWASFNTGTLPIVPVYDLEQNSNMIAGTHGRGVWAMKTPVPPTLSVRPRKLGFGNEFFGGHAGASSTARNVTIFNLKNKKQDATVAITGVGTTGDFTVPSGVCQGPLAPGASCPVPVTFTPAGLGSRPGTLTVFNSGSANAQVVLSGRGARGKIGYEPKSLNFGKVAQGATSAPQTVTISNPNGAALDLGTITASGSGFSISASTCGPSLGAGAPPCSVSVTFTPPSVGTQKGALTINDFAKGSPHIVKLTGTGT